MLFSEQTLADIRARLDIVEFIGAQMPLKRAGANFVALCPFHREKTPSFSVSPAKQIFYCFGCHAGGDLFKFVMLRENLDFPAAVRLLAERAGVTLRDDRGDGDKGETRTEKEQLYKLHEQVCGFYQHHLAKNPAAQIARDYLAKRALSADSVKLFRIGYAPDSWDATFSWLTGKKFSTQLLERSGLAIRRERGEGYYDRFRGRLMFPIGDEQGRVVGFSGRVLTAEAEAAKYVNSPETPIFQKGRLLFGLDKTKQSLLEEKCAVICEGQIDLISCVQHGFTNVVAPQGTALTADHARILKRYVDEVVLCFDSDEAGQNAAVRSLDALLESGLSIRVASVPEGHDPDSLVRSSADTLRKLIADAPGYFEFRLNQLCREHDKDTDVGRSRIARALCESLAKIGDAVLRDRVLRAAAHRLDVHEGALREELSKLAKRRTTMAAQQVIEGKSSTTSDRVTPPPERELLHLLIADESGAVLRESAKLLDRVTLPDSPHGKAIGRILDASDANRVATVKLVMLDHPDLAMKPLRCANLGEATGDAIEAIHRAARRAEIERVRQSLRSPTLSTREKDKLSRLLLDLQR